MENFYAALFSEIIGNLNNDYHDNYDYYRFGVAKENEQPKKTGTSLRRRMVKFLDTALAKKNYVRSNNNHTKYIHAVQKLAPYFNALEAFYNMLADEASKNMLVKLLTFRVLGHKKIKLPLNTEAYWDGIKTIEDIADKNDFINVKFFDWKLSRINLNKKGIPVELYLMPVNTFRDFFLKQYEYKNDSVCIKVENGDYVIDAGGCWGDTALYFSNEAGEKGNVFSYEFIPSNIEILKKNLALNTQLEKRITLVDKPVWETSGTTMYYIDNGPGSKVFLDGNDSYDGAVESLSIDDLVMQYNMPKINFIKMDIEGAEPYALKGAVQTIKKFKPKLAIAIYHSMDDFINIPAFIASLNCGYKFYLGHYTIHTEETILFATAES